MTIFIGCTIAELAIFRPLIRILFQQIHDLMMVRIPGPDEPHQVLLMLDEFYHVGRMDSLISKITISAGYGFRMAIVMQDIAQLDELYGKHTRVTTVSGSQIKLFIQINDLDTSEFVSEMLGETTQVYKTPVARPGQGIFSARAWSPHYTPRPLKSPLELREMSARVAILMVKNSRSFQLNKIRDYQDQPYRKLFEATKGRPPALPTLHAWEDATLGGALAPEAAGTKADDVDEPTSPTSARNSARRPGAEPLAGSIKDGKAKGARSATGEKKKAPRKPQLLLKSDAASVPAAFAPPKPAAVPATPKKALSLGAEPSALQGENCNIRDVLDASEQAQGEEFAAMAAIMSAETEPGVRAATNTLRRLQAQFGDEDDEAC